jgi:hypothetical protein
MKSTNSLQPKLAPPEAFSAKKMSDDTPTTKIPWWWIRNDRGRQSVSVTFAAVAFTVTTMVYLAAAFEKLGSVTFRSFDVGACMAYFLPVLSLYFGRRLTDVKYSSKNDSSPGA